MALFPFHSGCSYPVIIDQPGMFGAQIGCIGLNSKFSRVHVVFSLMLAVPAVAEKMPRRSNLSISLSNIASTLVACALPRPHPRRPSQQSARHDAALNNRRRSFSRVHVHVLSFSCRCSASAWAQRRRCVPLGLPNARRQVIRAGPGPW